MIENDCSVTQLVVHQSGGSETFVSPAHKDAFLKGERRPALALLMTAERKIQLEEILLLAQGFFLVSFFFSLEKMRNQEKTIHALRR